MTHPSSLDLEAFACGEVSGPCKVAEHLAVCDACAAFVARLGALTGPTAAQADALIARALARVVEIKPSVASSHVASVASAGSAEKQSRKSSKGRLWLVTTSIITPLAAAAAVLLLARSNPDSKLARPAPAPSTTSTAPDRILMAPLPGSVSEPDTTFKGGLQIAVVRDRGGEQARFASGVRVRPGDRLRVEVALDREQAILGAVLSDDGSYLELMPLAVRGPGTHFSEKSAKIDGSPTYGTIVIGTPEAVARARATRQLDGVVSLRVEWEGTP
jgi:hypothetical protein